MITNFKLAVASGKGGTGKTTIATNLAMIAAKTQSSVKYLDCDVEAPNGHLFLKPELTCNQKVALDVPQIDLEKCNGCGQCGQICQFNAIVSIAAQNVLTFEQLCHGCGGCIRVCPTSAITAKPMDIGVIERGRSDSIEFVHGRLNIGYVNTPWLIKNVKKHIEPKDFSIIDVPPGTSCPVVAAIKDTDFVLLVTEPTPFGLHDLKLAVGLVRKMNIPLAVVINRYQQPNTQTEHYCKTENIDIAMKLPNDRRIAEAYSVGIALIQKFDEYVELFENLYSYLKNAKGK